MFRLSGRLRSCVIIGLQGIRARKLRTFLSLVSLFLGVLAVVVVQAGAELARATMLSQSLLGQGRDGTWEIYLPEGTEKMAMEVAHGRPGVVALQNMSAIVGEPAVEPLNPGGTPFDDPGGMYGSPGRVMVCRDSGCEVIDNTAQANVPKGQAIQLKLSAVTGDLRQFRPFAIKSGDWLEFSSEPSLAPGIVINQEAAKGFTRYQIPAEMRLGGSKVNPTPRILGVVDDGQSVPTAYARYDEIANWTTGPDPAARRQEPMQLLLAPQAREVNRILQARVVAAGGKPSDVSHHEIDALSSAATELAVLRWVFLGMASLVLLIGVAGVLNVGLATVGERIEEFALRRAVGTPRMLLAGIVLAETLLTGLFTAAAAVGTGALGLRLVIAVLADRQPSIADLTFPWQAGVAGVVAGVAAGVLGGLVPAVRAARIPIATVMRA